MSDKFTLITPADYVRHEPKRTLGRWRVTVWDKGRRVVFKDFVYEALADGWAEKIRKDYKDTGALGVFVKKENMS